jgi:hypothetical protein
VNKESALLLGSTHEAERLVAVDPLARNRPAVDPCREELFDWTILGARLS